MLLASDFHTGSMTLPAAQEAGPVVKLVPRILEILSKHVLSLDSSRPLKSCAIIDEPWPRQLPLKTSVFVGPGTLVQT
jgi:hypothetical protein